MGIYVLARISEIGGRRFAGILRSVKSCGRNRMMTTSSSSVNSDEKADSRSRISPWLMLRPHFKSDDMVYRFYSLEHKEVVRIDKRGGGREMESNKIPGNKSKFVGSSHGWLALFDHSNRSLFLSDPICRRHIELPSVPDSEEWPSRVMISCSPDDQECRALMCYGPEQRLAFCVPGRSDKWFPMEGHRREVAVNGKMKRFEGRKYENFAYSSRRKTFFCIAAVRYKENLTAEMESWDLSDPDSPRISWSLGPDFDSLNFDSCWYPWPASSEEESDLKKYECLQYKYLVFDEPSDQLYLVVRHVIPRVGPDGFYRSPIRYCSKLRGWDYSCPHKTVDFDVYKIDMERKLVCHMDSSLDGLAMFVGINHPIAVRAASQLKPDSIYFTELPEHMTLYHGGHDNGVFDYESGAFSSCHRSYPIHLPSIKQGRSMALPLWYTPMSDLLP